MKNFALLIVFSALWFGAGAQAEQITFPSASPYQLGQVLKGNLSYDLEITATLQFPQGIEGKVGALVFIHGSGGILSRHTKYLELARRLGLASLQIDSFGPRGVTSTIGSRTSVTAAMMAVDAHAALKYLARHPRIDASRVFLMGSSKGGTATLYSAWSPARRVVLGDLDYAGRIALYPACAHIEDGDVSASPLVTMIGEKDNWTPADNCVAMTKIMSNAGNPWSIILYEGAYHGFDDATRAVRTIPNAYNITGCDFALRADGIEYEKNSGFELTRADRRRALGACARKGDVLLGGNHALPTLMKDLEAFLVGNM
jgi:dienelactone hydrolase